MPFTAHEHRGLVASVLLPAALMLALVPMRSESSSAAGSGDPSALAEVRARKTEERMTDAERLDMIYSLMPVVFSARQRDPRVPDDVPQLAGWSKGVRRLGVPDLLQTDASLGITNPNGGRHGDTATALPSGLALGSTFNPALAKQAGQLLGVEARSRGFNVLLGGGMNLVRDPRHGRNFEYLSEDPWLSAVMTAESIAGTQSKGVLAMVKHVSLNSHETNKHVLNAQIDPAAHRESELLAFQIAIERGNPAAMMCAYNKVNGEYACGNDPILNGVVKQAFGFKGFVMSDWRAVYDWDFALKGLDMHSGAQLDKEEWFVGPLREAYAAGNFPKERLSDMVRRILWGIYLVGADKWDGRPTPDMAAHRAAALETARQGIILLKNDGALPLAPSVKRIAVIGGFANLGVMGGGGGSSQVIPPGGFALTIPLGGNGPLAVARQERFIAPGPLESLKKLLPDAEILFDSGEYPANAATLARRIDTAIVFARKFESEGYDQPDLTLPNGQDVLVQAVTAANPNTIVVLETGNPVVMPWHEQANAIVEAWFPGEAGGQAIAEILTGRVNPSGRLPITFPRNIEQTPHPKLAGFATPQDTPTEIRYDEGAEVGYRWFTKTHAQPLYGFGHGLSYTTFSYSDFDVSGGDTVTASVTVTNAGARPGADVPQIYLTSVDGSTRMRLLGFERVELAPGESKRITVVADPRLLAQFDTGAGQWRLAGSVYEISVARSANELVATAKTSLTPRLFGK
jgi:beta-glucosidase